MYSNPILSAIQKRFEAQQEKGLQKYGEYVNIDSHSLIEWMEHLQQELMDAMVYIEVIKQKVEAMKDER